MLRMLKMRGLGGFGGLEKANCLEKFFLPTYWLSSSWLVKTRVPSSLSIPLIRIFRHIFSADNLGFEPCIDDVVEEQKPSRSAPGTPKISHFSRHKVKDFAPEDSPPGDDHESSIAADKWVQSTTVISPYKTLKKITALSGAWTLP